MVGRPTSKGDAVTTVTAPAEVFTQVLAAPAPCEHYQCRAEAIPTSATVAACTAGFDWCCGCCGADGDAAWEAHQDNTSEVP